MVWFTSIPKHPNYVVSNKGDVASIRRGRFKTLALSNHGKYNVGTIGSEDGKIRTRLVRHLVLESFRSFRPQGTECRHLNGNGKDNRVENLSWGTPLENGSDRKRHGTVFHPMTNGTSNGRAMLTEDQIPEIRNSKLSIRALAKKHQVCRATIWYIKNKLTWRHVPC